jgi:hypothetical protein
MESNQAKEPVMRASNVTRTDRHEPETHGAVNPEWHRHAMRVFAGRGKQAEQVDMVIITSRGGEETVEGWDANGRWIVVRNVKATRMLNGDCDVFTADKMAKAARAAKAQS